MKGLTLLKNYYIVEDIGEEYEESGNSQSEGIQIVKFSKQLEKESLYQERQVYNEMVKNMYEGLTLSITVTYGDEQQRLLMWDSRQLMTVMAQEKYQIKWLFM